MNILSYDVTQLPTKNYHLSLCKIIMDQWEIATAEIEYGVEIFHVMETTKFQSAEQLSWNEDQWPIWANADYVWKRSTADRENHVTSSYSMNRLMLFSENRQV